MVDKFEENAVLSLKALKRAALRAAMEAKNRNLKVPIWKDGKIEYINPQINTEQVTALDFYSTGLRKNQ